MVIFSFSSLHLLQKSAVLNYLKTKNIKAVNFSDWKKIDASEIERGKPLGKPREKFIEVEEMLAVI